ncbi:hypothetical protein METP2_02903 [Methanosarcinales archaeon]|nr:hypothetical protein [Candidatus Methanoperedens sp.]CAG0995745.1 hypothetical protein METP2_02903 [Methanosarcinales archaeon]
MTSINLDRLAAEHAQQMVSNLEKDNKSVAVLERLVTKTLGVLQAQGVYAMMLYLWSRSGDENKIAPVIRNECYALIKELPDFSGITVPEEKSDDKTTLKFYSSDAVQKIDTLLLIRDLYEQTLIYARYGAKSASKEK